MAISAAAVKELRDKTGAGMMDCQRALTEADGNLEEAVKILRKKGLSAAARKAGRAAKDGLVVVVVAADASRGAMVELNCETDFVARTERYQDFARRLADQAMADSASDAAAMAALPFAGAPEHTVAQAISSEIATIGENIVLSRVAFLAAGEGMKVGSYTHMGGKIGVLVEASAGADDGTVRDVAMHVAAAEPRFVSRERVPAEVIAEEREIALAQVPPGKPDNVVEKILEGKVAKFFEQVCLLEQPFVKNPDETVGAMLQARGGITVARFERFKLGEAPGADGA